MNPDERLVQVLRSVLDDVDDALARQAAPHPPWAQLQEFIRHSRERRRWTLAVAAAALAVVVVVVAQNRLFPVTDEGFDPVPTAPPFAEWTEPRGSLAGDQEWLSEFEEWAKAHPLENDGTSTPAYEPEPAQNVQVLYASDLGDFRVAVVVGDWPKSGQERRTVEEFYGARGAAPEQMLSNNGGPAPDLTTGPDTYRSVLTSGYPVRGLPDEQVRRLRSVAYLLTDGAPKTYLQQPPTIDAAGKVTQHARLIEFKNGLAELTFDQPGHYAVYVPGRDQGYDDLFGQSTYHDFFSIPEEEFEPQVSNVPSRGGDQPAAEIRGMAEPTWGAARQSYAVGDLQLLAAEPGELSENGPARAMVAVYTLPSGARVVAAGHGTRTVLDMYGGRRTAFDDADLDIAQLRPAGEDGDLVIAWRIDQEKERPARTAAMGPAGTTSVEWTLRGGGTTVTPTGNTLAVVTRTDVTGARFLGVDGSELGQAEVLDPVAWRFNRSTQPDKTPDRANGQAWLLPEIEDGLAGF